MKVTPMGTDVCRPGRGLFAILPSPRAHARGYFLPALRPSGPPGLSGLRRVPRMPDYVAHLTDEDLNGGHAAIRKVGRLPPRGARAFQPAATRRLPAAFEFLRNPRPLVACCGQECPRASGDRPATGRRMVWRDMVTSRFRDGLIAEEWVISDLAERFLLARKRA